MTNPNFDSNNSYGNRHKTREGRILGKFIYNEMLEELPRLNEAQLAFTDGYQICNPGNNKGLKQLLIDTTRSMGLVYGVTSLEAGMVVEGNMDAKSLTPHMHGLLRIHGWEDRNKTSMKRACNFVQEVLSRVHAKPVKAHICEAYDPLGFVTYGCKSWSYSNHVITHTVRIQLPEEVVTPKAKYRSRVPLSMDDIYNRAAVAYEQRDYATYQSLYLRYESVLHKQKKAKEEERRRDEALAQGVIDAHLRHTNKAPRIKRMPCPLDKHTNYKAREKAQAIIPKAGMEQDRLAQILKKRENSKLAREARAVWEEKQRNKRQASKAASRERHENKRVSGSGIIIRTEDIQPITARTLERFQEARWKRIREVNAVRRMRYDSYKRDIPNKVQASTLQEAIDNAGSRCSKAGIINGIQLE
jgi:hypothetical protein